MKVDFTIPKELQEISNSMQFTISDRIFKSPLKLKKRCLTKKDAKDFILKRSLHFRITDVDNSLSPCVYNHLLQWVNVYNNQ